MKINLAFWDRLIRYALGFLLFVWALVGGPTWSWFGLVLIATAAWGICPVYVILGFKTYREKIKKQ